MNNIYLQHVEEFKVAENINPEAKYKYLKSSFKYNTWIAILSYIPSLSIIIWKRSWFTFIYIWREASDKDFPGVTLQPLSILTAGWRVQAWSQGWVTMAVIKETILKGKKTGATWETGHPGRQTDGEDRILKKKLKESVGATLSQSNLDSFFMCKTVFIFGSNLKNP